MNHQTKFVILFSFIILSICFYIYIQRTQYPIKYIQSTIDNQIYLVRNELNSVDAANLIATIRLTLIKFIDLLYSEYPKYTQLLHVKNKLIPQNISETYKKEAYTSYSINKGDKIYFCVRSKKNKLKLIDKNTLMFVALHELAHMMTNEFGHTPKFWENFAFLVKKAKEYKLYNDIDYTKNPQEYCGIIIKTNP